MLSICKHNKIPKYLQNTSDPTVVYSYSLDGTCNRCNYILDMIDDIKNISKNTKVDLPSEIYRYILEKTDINKHIEPDLTMKEFFNIINDPKIKKPIIDLKLFFITLKNKKHLQFKINNNRGFFRSISFNIYRDDNIVSIKNLNILIQTKPPKEEKHLDYQDLLVQGYIATYNMRDEIIEYDLDTDILKDVILRDRMDYLASFGARTFLDVVEWILDYCNDSESVKKFKERIKCFESNYTDIDRGLAYTTPRDVYIELYG